MELPAAAAVWGFQGRARDGLERVVGKLSGSTMAMTWAEDQAVLMDKSEGWCACDRQDLPGRSGVALENRCQPRGIRQSSRLPAFQIDL
jgi:hypothetical protein